MKLTGKTREEFTIQYGTITHLPESCQNALIIDFFDSVGINILIDTLHFQNWFFYRIKKDAEEVEDVNMHKTRTEAINQAIIKGNDLYNQK